MADDLWAEIERLMQKTKKRPLCGKPLTPDEELLWERLCELANRIVAL